MDIVANSNANNNAIMIIVLSATASAAFLPVLFLTGVLLLQFRQHYTITQYVQTDYYTRRPSSIVIMHFCDFLITIFLLHIN